MLKIKKLSNFAVIKTLEDELEMKDLTIFMGDNSAGKSYLAMLIHSFIAMERGYNDPDFVKAVLGKFNTSNLITDLKSYIKNIVNENDEITFSLSLENYKETIEKIIYFSINEYLIKKYLMGKIFKNTKLEEIDLELLGLNKSILKQCTININISGTSRRVEILFDQSIRSIMLLPKEFSNDLIEKHILNSIISTLIERSIKKTLPDNSIYLPASRTGYLQTYKALAKYAIESDLAGSNNLEKSDLSIIVRFFISQLNNSREFEDNKFSKYIEDFIMNGKVNVFDDNNDINFELKDGQKIDINYLSSTVSELIPLVVFLKRGLIKKNGLLVIEEPEAHLSFKNQKMIAKLITLLIQNQIKVLITTHSDFLVYELNNLMMKHTILKNLDKLNVLEHDISILDDKISLDYKKVSLYNFLLENNHSVVKKVSIDKYGIANEYIFNNTYSITKDKNILFNMLEDIDA